MKIYKYFFIEILVFIIIAAIVVAMFMNGLDKLKEKEKYAKLCLENLDSYSERGLVDCYFMCDNIISKYEAQSCRDKISFYMKYKKVDNDDI